MLTSTLGKNVRDQIQRETIQRRCKVTCGKCNGFFYSKQQQWTYSAFHNTVILIQMASGAQEPVIHR